MSGAGDRQLDELLLIGENPGDMTRDSESRMAAVQYKTINPQMIQSDQVTMAEILLSDCLKCQSERQVNGGDREEEYSDWSDEDVSQMPPEKKKLCQSFLNNSYPYNPLHFNGPPKVMSFDGDHAAAAEEEEEPVPPCSQEKDHLERSEDEDSDWSDEGVSDEEEISPENKKLLESFFNKHDPYNPLHFSCPTEVNLKASEMQQNHTPLRPTASEVEEHISGQSRKGQAKKVTFCEEVTIHILDRSDVDSRAARNGSCWMQMARDRARFRRRVEKAEKIIGPCLTAQHRAKVLQSIKPLGWDG